MTPVSTTWSTVFGQSDPALAAIVTSNKLCNTYRDTKRQWPYRSQTAYKSGGYGHFRTRCDILPYGKAGASRFRRYLLKAKSD
jgi:hypothetical protein